MKLLPEDGETLQVEGRKIRVKKWEEIGGISKGQDTFDTALYTDAKGNFYVANVSGKTIEYCLNRLGLSEVFMPRDAHLIDSVSDEKMSARQVTENAALAWYVWEFMSDTPLARLFDECIRWHVPKVERAGKAQLRAWVRKGTAGELSRTAIANGITPPQQLELLLADGLRHERARRAAKRAGKVKATAFAVQLELATTLVEVVRSLDAKPNPAALSEACRGVSALHQSLHQPDAFKSAGAL